MNNSNLEASKNENCTTHSAMEIPFFKADIGHAEIDEVVAALKSGWLTSGPRVKKFEERFAEMIGAKHAIAVNSATAGLHLALEAAGVGPGDEVLVPTITFAATAEVVIHLGATPILVDCRESDLNICLEDLKRKRTEKTAAVMPVHYGGQPCEMDRINAFANQHELAVIEDAAHAFPAAYKGKRVGTLSALTCFSFYANKTITTGEGGMVTTDDPVLASRIRMMSLHGLSRDAWNRFSKDGKWRYDVVDAGYKYNLTDIAAAIGIQQLTRADQFRSQRMKQAEKYNSGFDDIDAIETLTTSDTVDHAWHLFVIKIKSQKLTIDRNQFIELLRSSGISTSVHYTPLHMHSLYRDRFGYSDEMLPVAAKVFEEIVSLPIFPGMTDAEQEYVIHHVRRIVDENRP